MAGGEVDVDVLPADAAMLLLFEYLGADLAAAVAVGSSHTRVSACVTT